MGMLVINEDTLDVSIQRFYQPKRLIQIFKFVLFAHCFFIEQLTLVGTLLSVFLYGKYTETGCDQFV